MLNVLSTLAMTGLMAIGGGTATVSAPTADIVVPNAITFQIEDENEDDNSEVREFFQTERVEAAADILGLTVDELEAEKEAGTTMSELIEEAGLTAEEFRDLIAVAREEAIQEAIDTGLITEEEAAQIGEKRGNRGGRQGNRGPQPEIVAELLGTDVETVEAAREDDTLEQLIEDAGYTEETFREAISEARQAAREARVAEALENGDITEEEAEAILSGEGRGRRGGRGNGGNDPVN